MLVGGDLFLSDVQFNRIISITGQRGTGKTAMAFELAQWYLRRGYRLITNIDTIWQDKYLYARLLDPEYVRHAVIILDEGGRYLRTWAYFENMFEFARKFDNYIFIPSVRLAHENLAEFVARPNTWLQRILPLDFHQWEYEIKTGDKNIYGSFWFRPSETIGVYDTGDVSQNPSFIIDAFSRAIQYEAKKRGRSEQSILGLDVSADADEQAALLRDQAKNTRDLLSLYRRRRKK